MIESRIEKKLKQKIDELGGIAYKFISPGNNGVPDRIVVLPGGRIIFAELKTAAGVESAAQILQRKLLQSLGCDCRVLYGEEEVTAFVEEVSNAIRTA